MKSLIFLLLFYILTPLFAAEKDPNIRLHQVINKYRNSPAVEMKFSKTLVMLLLGEDTSSRGKLYLSSNRMRYEITSPEKHLVVMNKKSIYIENRRPKELGGKIQVTHLKSEAGKNKVKGFLAAFFGNANIKKDLDFKKIDKNTFKVLFKKKSQISDIKSARIGISDNAEELKFIEYTDSLQNKTRHDFSAVKFKTKADNSKFKYVVPKGAEVTEM